MHVNLDAGMPLTNSGMTLLFTALISMCSIPEQAAKTLTKACKSSGHVANRQISSAKPTPSGAYACCGKCNAGIGHNRFQVTVQTMKVPNSVALRGQPWRSPMGGFWPCPCMPSSLIGSKQSAYDGGAQHLGKRCKVAHSNGPLHCVVC